MAVTTKKTIQPTDVETEIIENTKTEPKQATPSRKAKFKKDIPLNTMVKVINGTYGELFYKSKRTNGYSLTLSNFGDEDYIELAELVSAKNTDKRFFTENWWLIEDEEIIEFLSIGQYYQNSITVDDFEHLFYESPEDVLEKVSAMSDGLKRTVAARAHDLIEKNKLYDNRVIRSIETATGFELMD